MEVKEAVRIAKAYIGDLFADEHIRDVGLEEVEFDDSVKKWRVTVGFRRPWEKPVHSKGPASVLHLPTYSHVDRWYKLVTIRDRDGRVLSVVDRELKSAA